MSAFVEKNKIIDETKLSRNDGTVTLNRLQFENEQNIFLLMCCDGKDVDNHTTKISNNNNR